MYSYLGEMLVLPLVASRCTLFLEGKKGRSEDAGLAEVDGDETPAEVGEGSDGATSGGGGRTPSRISAGKSRGGDGGAAAVDRSIRNSEQVLQERGEREEEVGDSAVAAASAREGGPGGMGREDEIQWGGSNGSGCPGAMRALRDLLPLANSLISEIL